MIDSNLREQEEWMEWRTHGKKREEKQRRQNQSDWMNESGKLWPSLSRLRSLTCIAWQALWSWFLAFDDVAVLFDLFSWLTLSNKITSNLRLRPLLSLCLSSFFCGWVCVTFYSWLDSCLWLMYSHRSVFDAFFSHKEREREREENLAHFCTASLSLKD